MSVINDFEQFYSLYKSMKEPERLVERERDPKGSKYEFCENCSADMDGIHCECGCGYGYSKCKHFYGYKCDSYKPKCESKLQINKEPLADICKYKNPSIEDAYKQGIKDAIEWVVEPFNEWERDEESGSQTYLIDSESIKEFLEEKGIK